MDIEPNPHNLSARSKGSSSRDPGSLNDQRQMIDFFRSPKEVSEEKGRIDEEKIRDSNAIDDQVSELYGINHQVSDKLEIIKQVKESLSTGLANLEKLEQIDDYRIRENVLDHLGGDLSRKPIVIQPVTETDTHFQSPNVSPPKLYLQNSVSDIVNELEQNDRDSISNKNGKISQSHTELKVSYSKPKFTLKRVIEDPTLPADDDQTSFRNQNFQKLLQQRNYLEKIYKYMENLFEGNIDLLNDFEKEAEALQKNINRYIDEIAKLSLPEEQNCNDHSTYEKLGHQINDDGDLTKRLRVQADEREAELQELEQNFILESRELNYDLEELENLERQVQLANQSILSDQSEIENLEEAIRALENEIQRYHTSLIQHSNDRRIWSNEYQNLKGSIRVYVRVKPLTSGLTSPINCVSDRVLKLTVPKTMLKSENQTKEYTYDFEHIYNHNTTQEQMFRELEPLMTSVIDGYNVCILAYGPTGSGKTFTIMGNGILEFKGLAPRALEVLFRLLKEKKDKEEIDYQTKVSLIEVHMDNVKNLLEDTRIDISKGRKLKFFSKSRENLLDEERSNSMNMDFFSTNSIGSNIMVEKVDSFNSSQKPFDNLLNNIGPTQSFSNMKPRMNNSPINSKSKNFTRNLNKEFSKETTQEKIIISYEEACNVLERGLRNRVVACTAANDESSRSHLIFKVEIETQHSQTGEVRKGSLVLVDLAGSERLNTSKTEGERLEETKAINKSLTALGDVVNALYNKMPHIPFRNSKLTSLLQDCLSGDAKALMIINISSDESEFQQTLSSLKFAEKVRNVPKLEKKPNPNPVSQKSTKEFKF